MTVGLLLLSVVLLAGHDNNIEWNGVTHIPWIDRAPLCPVDGESFVVSFQTYAEDITSARVYVDDGAATWVDAEFSHRRGPYDVWRATVPPTAPAGMVQYYFELTDGTDTDYLGPDGMSETPPASAWVLNFATNSHAPLGATLTSDGGAVFKVWAPGASSARLAGEFTNWQNNWLTMTKSGGYFTRRAAAPVSAGQQYKYVFNGSLWKPDARGRAWNPSQYNNSIIVDPPAYEWNDPDFTPPPFEEMVIYELHVGTFSGYNDGLNRMGRFRDIVDTHLDHLVALGVNVIELMPITEFDYYESWGYNPVNHWGPENAYGSPEDLKYTIDVLHQNGIAVILDVVYNHFSHSGNELWCYDGTQVYFDGDCYGGACDTPWGSQAAFWKAEVYEYFLQNVLYWIEEYHVDGFRVDATTYMRPPLGCYAEGWYLMQDMNRAVDARKINAIMIAEELPDNAWITRSVGQGGAGFDSQWHDRFVDDVRQAIFEAAYGDPQMWKVRDAILGRLNDAGGTYITDWGQSTTQLVNYVESHDEAGGEGTGQDNERLAVTIDSSNPYSKWAKGRSKLAQGLVILSPGIPMFLMGGEWMEDIKFGSGWENRIDWSKAESRAPIVQFFRDAIAVRKSNGGLRANAGCEVHHVNDADNVLAMHRWDLSGNDLIIVASFGNVDRFNYRIGFPQPGTWYEILNSQASEYLGNGLGNGGSITTESIAYDGMPHSAAITIPEMGLLVFRYNHPPVWPGDLNCDGSVDGFDIQPFVLALTDPQAYEAAYPNCNVMNADCNGDGVVDGFDIQPFVALLTGL